MSIELFRRGMEWRKEADARLARRRDELSAEGTPTMAYGLGGSSCGSAAEHVDSYWEYRRLVGESDGGTLLSEEAYAELRQLAARAAKNRLYVTWRNTRTGLDCYTVGPDSRCFCGHSYKAHAWYNTETRRVHCRCAGCACEGFEYVVGHGAWWIKCTCKHGHDEHEGGRGRCGHAGCGCGRFFSSFSCVCCDAWADHATTVETRAERRASGRPTHNLCGGGGVGEAACGGVSRMSSLVPGIDRIETALPFTDAGFFAHRLPSAEEGAQTQRALLDALPDESLHMLRELLDERADEEIAPEIAPVIAAPADDNVARGRDATSVGGPGRAGVSGAAAGQGAAAGAAARPAGGPRNRSAVIAAHDAALRDAIEALEAQLAQEGVSAATRHGLKRQLAQKKAALKRDVPA